jgi:hypothetical protein
MKEMKTIHVSERTYQRLLSRLDEFGKTADDVIEDLLDACTLGNGSGSTPSDGSVGMDLVSTGGRLSHGTRLRAVYKGTEYLAEVRNGKLYWDGKAFGSPSEAAIAVIQSAGSPRTTENGWRFWAEAQPPEAKGWLPMAKVRGD